MKFELQVGNRLRTVEIHQRADGYDVRVDGRTRHVDARHFGASAWSLLVRDGNGGANRSVDATVIPLASAGFDVHIGGFHIPVRLKGGAGRRSRERAAQRSDGGPQRVSAPMPGKVLRVLVKAGDEVNTRQELVVVEAMKMENELRAVTAGRVRQVFVTEGQSVEAGTPLVEIE